MAGSHRAGGGQGGTSGTRRLRRPPGPAGKGEGRGAAGKSPRPAPPAPSLHFFALFFTGRGRFPRDLGGGEGCSGPPPSPRVSSRRSPSLHPAAFLRPLRCRRFFSISTSALLFCHPGLSRRFTPQHPTPRRGDTSGCRGLAVRTGAPSRRPGGRPAWERTERGAAPLCPPRPCEQRRRQEVRQQALPVPRPALPARGKPFLQQRPLPTPHFVTI